MSIKERIGMENTQPKRKRIFLRILAVIAALLLIVFIILRCTHVILRIGKKYTTCFDSAINVYGLDIDENDMKEFKYLKQIDLFRAYGTDIRNFDFLNNSDSLTIIQVYVKDTEQEHTADGMPSLRKCQWLWSLGLSVDVKNLDFIAENQHLKVVGIWPNNTNIEDISGLKNKPELTSLSLHNVDCSDMSPLLELENLQDLSVIGTIIPDDIMEKLTERKVRIKNLSVEDYKKQQKDKKRQEEAKQKALQKESE